MNRLFRKDRALILALDHGFPLGNVKEIEDVPSILNSVRGVVDALILNRGLILTLDSELLGFEVLYKLNGITTMAPNPYGLVTIGSVEEAVSLDAVGVSFEMYVGGPQEEQQLRELSSVLKEVQRYDIPLVLHVYPHGESRDPKLVSHAMRVGWEVGADVVKTFYYSGMRSQVEKTAVPVVVAGGPKMETEDEVVNYVKWAVREGARGVAMGRNLWGWKDVKRLASSIREVLDSREGGE
ncbi:fructose-bisphosphate aldolase [Sulfodiicoccus acidiphilus]|uniref:Fructose-bisphosphate aldolase n=1 Tax=Sulfodiicoccus acidiphilus TaxID=1670455 RepID=A0A830H1W9_9CREN|nr:fructose-bisphosphate aldolase [Sulfodiicoccus acidiphilus]